MANRGDTIDNPVQGIRVTFRKTTRDTGGEYVRLDLYAQPGGVGIGEYFHPRLEERFEPRAATEATVKGIYWPGEVPYYWIGKTAWIGYCRKPKGEPNTRYLWHHRGIVLAATETGILMDADIPPQLGIERHRAKYPYQTITNVWLV